MLHATPLGFCGILTKALCSLIHNVLVELLGKSVKRHESFLLRYSWQEFYQERERKTESVRERKRYWERGREREEEIL